MTKRLAMTMSTFALAFMGALVPHAANADDDSSKGNDEAVSNVDRGTSWESSYDLLRRGTSWE